MEGYDDGEDKIIDYLFSNSNMSTIKESVKESIRELYQLNNNNNDEEL
jgi:hypothetical protein